MKKDMKNEKLLEEQLGQVQGGLVNQIPTATIIYCLQPGCNWVYNGLVDGAEAARQAHTNATGHNQFAWSKPQDRFGH